VFDLCVCVCVCVCACVQHGEVAILSIYYIMVALNSIFKFCGNPPSAVFLLTAYRKAAVNCQSINRNRLELLFMIHVHVDMCIGRHV